MFRQMNVSLGTCAAFVFSSCCSFCRQRMPEPTWILWAYAYRVHGSMWIYCIRLLPPLLFLLLLLSFAICIVHIDVVSVIVAVVRLQMLIGPDTFSRLHSRCCCCLLSTIFVVILVILQPRFSWAESNMINAMQRTSKKNPFWLTHLAFFDSDNNESLATSTQPVASCTCVSVYVTNDVPSA